MHTLVGAPEENPFEAAVLYERVGKIIVKYLKRFGPDERLKNIALNCLKISKELWSKEGYKKKVEEINRIASELQRI